MHDDPKMTPFSQEGKPSPKRYMNAGPQITNRLETFLHVLGQQGVLRFDQAQRILGRLSPEPDKMKQPGILSAERTRKFLRPWFNEELLNYRVFYANQKGGFWLTAKGLKYANLNLRYYEPTPASLQHHYAVNEIRLLVEARRPQETWRSERELRAAQPAHAKGSPASHLPDAELIDPNGTIKAIECELTVKSEKRLEEIIFDLAGNKRYHTIWYFLPEQVYNAVKACIKKLPAEHRKRFVLYTLEGEVYSS
jgi:hypothetical protein